MAVQIQIQFGMLSWVVHGTMYLNGSHCGECDWTICVAAMRPYVKSLWWLVVIVI